MTDGGQVIIRGRGSCRRLGEILRKRLPKKILLVTGKESFAISGAEQELSDDLAAFGFIRFSQFGSNLQLNEILDGATVFKKNECDFVVGVGGGSVIDMAKAAALLGTQPTELTYDIGLRFLAGAPPAAAPAPTIIIPTTAGTGSESTHFSVIYVEHTKHSLAHDSMLPDVAILDPALTDSMPPRVTAGTGLDALCQAVESFWSVQSTEASRALSRQALEICIENLVRAVKQPTPSVRDKMVTAANLSGQAIALARTTVAHAASYPLSSHYRIAHGHAVALFLPHMLYHNCLASDALITDTRGPAFVRERMNELLQIMQADSPEAARDWLIDLVATVGLETSLSQLGVQSEAVEKLADECLASDRSRNNPSTVSHSDVLAMLEAML